MKDEDKSKEQLLKELKAMKEWVVNQEFFEFERKKAEDALKSSEKRFEDIALSSADWIWEVDQKGKYTYASGKVKEILGYEPDELIGKTVYDLMSDADARKLSEMFKRIAKKKQPLRNNENWIITKDHKKILTLTNGVPIIDKKGKLQGYRGVTKDITEEKRSGKTLEFLKFSVEHTQDAAYWMGPDAKFIYVNEAACNELGYTREELLNMTVHDINPDFPPEVWPGHWKEIKKKKQFLIESHHRTKKGKLIPVEISINYMEFDGQEYNFAFVRDITERKHAEGILKEGEARLLQIIDQMPYSIEVCSPDGTATLVNKAFVQMRGLDSVDEVIGKHNVFKNSLVKDIGIIDDVKKVYEGKTVFLPKVKVLRDKINKNGHEDGGEDQYYEITMFPVLKPNGDLWRAVTIWKDITQIRVED
jgi:PAS domain S-box-containing protein